MGYLSYSDIFDDCPKIQDYVKANDNIVIYGSRTTPHEDNSPPDQNKAQPLPTRTTIPRTIPHQDNSPLGPLPWNKTTHQDSGPKPVRWGIVLLGSCPDTCITVWPSVKLLLSSNFIKKSHLEICQLPDIIMQLLTNQIIHSSALTLIVYKFHHIGPVYQSLHLNRNIVCDVKLYPLICNN